MKKIFLVAGELSGDQLGAWYLNYQNNQNNKIKAIAVGGNALQSAGAKIFLPMAKLNVTGILEVIKHIPRLLRYTKMLTNHIIEQSYDEVVLINFSGFNMKLAQSIKKRKPEQKITYFSPPQLWIWGAWRLKKLKKYCNKVIVLYQFEVEWYKQRGLKAEWIGSPHHDRLKKYYELSEKKKNKIAFLPASRESEFKKLFPIMLDLIKQFKLVHSNVDIILPIAETISRSTVEKELRKAGPWGIDVRIVQGEDEKYRELSTCCLAITKPGIVALELALLKIPSIVLYKTSWLTYLLARSFVKVSYMALPNLLLKKPLFPEFIQHKCRKRNILKTINTYYDAFRNNEVLYKNTIHNLDMFRSQFESAVKKKNEIMAGAREPAIISLKSTKSIKADKITDVR